MTEYELVCVVKPDVTPEQKETLDKKIQKVLTDHKVTGIDKRDWGLRRLAYPIQNHTTAQYYQWVFAGQGNVVSELERQLGYDDQVLRYLTVKVETATHRDGKPDDFQFGKIDWASAKRTFDRRGGGGRRFF